MLRLLLAALVAANLLFFGYTSGWFDGVLGLHSLGDREPERLARQVRPESVRILSAGASASAAAGCYEAGPFAGDDATAAESVLKAALPVGSWTDEAGQSPASTGPATSHVYRVASADAALAARLAGLRLGPPGRGFTPCAKPPAR